MDDECKFFESDNSQQISEEKMRDVNNDYDYRCPRCGGAENLVYLDHIIGCKFIIFSCEGCQIGFMTEDMIGQFFAHKRVRLLEKYPSK